MLNWLINRAYQKYNKETVRQGNSATADNVLKATQHYYQAAYNYAKACCLGFVKYNKVLRQKIKDSRLTETEYSKACQVSCKHNLEQYTISLTFRVLVFQNIANVLQAAISIVRQKAPSNVVINKGVKEHFKKNRRAANAKKQQYYYSTNIPSASNAPTALFQRRSLSKSLTKKGFLPLANRSSPSQAYSSSQQLVSLCMCNNNNYASLL